ncbi:MAG: hypothetical protein EOO90_01210 [Pedobacter sp.]|nr:MAG: hypothetical protein EOO90_01210 [Pedobacter sp.]
MEKDNFENLLRARVQEIEERTEIESDRERVWASIHQKRKPRRFRYAAIAAACFVMCGVVYLYFNERELPKTIAEQPPAITRIEARESDKQQPSQVKPLPKKRSVGQQVFVEHKVEEMPSHSDTVTKKNDPILVVETVAIMAEAPSSPQKTTSATLPEFTVQFKRGKPKDPMDARVRETIARLKRKGELQDTAIIANSTGKQKGLFKIKF